MSNNTMKETRETKHIGIVACSAEGAALCYRTICMEAPELLGEHNHPEITMHTFPLSRYMGFIRENDWQGVADLMIASSEILADAGADFAICPDNTIHQAFDIVARNSRIPWLHIAGAVASLAREKGYQKVGVLGTRYLMEGPVYPGALGALGLEHEVPDAERRLKINEIIFSKLVNGVFDEPSRRYFQSCIAALKNQGCDSVVLGCTEIPLLISQEHSSLPVLDSTRTLARAALGNAMKAELKPAEHRSHL